MAVKLLDGAASDGAGTTLTLHTPTRAGDQVERGTLYVWGPFDGATAHLEISPDGAEWFRPDTLTFTGKGAVNVAFRAHACRAYLAGSGAGTSVSVMFATSQDWG